MTHPSASRLIIAERFRSPDPGLSSVLLPLDVAASGGAVRLRFIVQGEADGADWRGGSISVRGLSVDDAVRLAFEPFASPTAVDFLLGVFTLPNEADVSIEDDLAFLHAAAAGRDPIVLDCGAGTSSPPPPDLLLDERGIAALRVRRASEASLSPAPPIPPIRSIRLVHWVDAYWRDAHGIYVRGWAHTHEHRVRSLLLESAGRQVEVTAFSERADLLTYYPEHDHVRHGGFAAYLPCPAGHPVRLTVSTEAGDAACELDFPDGAVPAWPRTDSSILESSAMWRHFAALVNAAEGPILQIGARTIPTAADAPAPWNACSILARPVIGFDIHPGRGVSVVGDAHALGSSVRAGSLGAVFSAAVLEHVQAPWLVAAEVNRALRPGGLSYHQVPCAWPAHAQPNDFWRFTDEGLRALFGPETGFEVLEAALLGPVALIPSPEWRRDYLDMPTVPAYACAEILSRKTRDLDPGAVAWPLDQAGSEARSRRYPIEALRPPSSAA